VVVADHCASSAGRAEIEVRNYHIPLIVYAPGGHVAPGRIPELTSQMDYAPTLLGLLGWSYPSRFLGHDVLRTPPAQAHALLGNYQKLGHLRDDLLVVLSPQRKVSCYAYTLDSEAPIAAPMNKHALEEGIAYYEAASYLYTRHLYRELSDAEVLEFSAAGRALAGAAAAAHSSPPR
jgi:hypothetical protein